MLGINKLLQSERQMHRVRWLVTIGWFVMIGSLFWNPIPLSPSPANPNQCVLVQGQCLGQTNAAIGVFGFWMLVVPSSILILLVSGHETWRRICPLSFLSQIPRALGIQRKQKSVSSKTGATRYELVKIKKDSWLGKNHLYVQFTLLGLGLAVRLLFFNSNPVALGIFLLLTIAAAIGVGFFYEGKSWCQYFCPMAPVQLVFNGPRGLLGSEAHQGQKQAVTQSMCRSIDKDGKEKSNCVGCQSPCIDIDAERTYWELFNKPGRKLIQYGYVGLLVGFFSYYALYAGSFEYLFSGAWLRETNQLGTVFSPGFYIAGQPIAIPKIVAVPLTLALSVTLSYGLLMQLEKVYRRSFSQPQKLSQQQISHLIFSVCTFLCFNIFFFFISRSLLSAYPLPVHSLFNGILVLLSTLWLSRTLGRSAERYSRESLAGSLRRQLSKLTINFSRFLDGRSMDDLKAEEIYVLAKVLPGFNQEQGLQVYKGVLRESLEQGTTDSASSLEMLRQIRQELNIKDEDHFAVLTELGATEPELLDPKKRRTRESQLRIESYRQSLAAMLMNMMDSGMSLQEAMQHQKKQFQFLKLEYGMTSEEEETVLSQLLAGEKNTILRKSEAFLKQMQQLADHDRILSQHSDTETAVFEFLRLTAVQHKQQIITKQMLGLLEVLSDSPDAIALATSTRDLAGTVLPEILQTPDGTLTWQQRLQPNVLAILEQPSQTVKLRADSRSLVEVLHELLHELDPLIQTLALYGLQLLVPEQARSQAQQILAGSQGHWLVKETAQSLLDNPQTVNEVQTLIVQVMQADQRERRSFQQPVIRIGRNPINDVVLDAPQVAPHHAILHLDGDGFSVLDLGNGGLFVGNKQLQGERDRLTQGQTIQFSEAENPAIVVSWEKQRLKTQLPTDIIGTIGKVLLLFESRFFRSLKPDALIELGRDAAVKLYARGEQMCQAGDPSDSILLLISGVADVVVVGIEGDHVVGTVNVGETIGEMGVLTRQKRSASVVAASDSCQALVIQANRFDSVLRQDPELARNLLVVLSSRLQSMTKSYSKVG